MTILNESLVVWLKERAEALDAGTDAENGLLSRLAVCRLFEVGVPHGDGGDGEAPSAAIAIVAQLAQHSLSAAFVFWAQRALVECVRVSPNEELVRTLLPALLHGRLAGAPGLSNAMKFLGGLGRLRVRAVRAAGGVQLHGDVPWATNLHPHGFVAALAAADENGAQASVFAVPYHAPGLARAPDLDLVALRGTHTAALRLDGVALDDAWQIHPDAKTVLPLVRPMFIGLQCGLGLGLARAALDAALRALDGTGSVLTDELVSLDVTLRAYWQALASGIDRGGLRERPHELSSLRRRIVELASTAVQLELQALGGRALVRGRDGGFNRRMREAAFLAVVTPTLVQLKSDMARLAATAQPNAA